MGVMRCQRGDCEEILCSVLLCGKYICSGCDKELNDQKENWPSEMSEAELKRRVLAFFETNPGDSRMLEGRQAINRAFDRLYDRDDG